MEDLSAIRHTTPTSVSLRVAINQASDIISKLYSFTCLVNFRVKQRTEACATMFPANPQKHGHPFAESQAKIIAHVCANSKLKYAVSTSLPLQVARGNVTQPQAPWAPMRPLRKVGAGPWTSPMTLQQMRPSPVVGSVPWCQTFQTSKPLETKRSGLCTAEQDV